MTGAEYREEERGGRDGGRERGEEGGGGGRERREEGGREGKFMTSSSEGMYWNLQIKDTLGPVILST